MKKNSTTTLTFRKVSRPFEGQPGKVWQLYLDKKRIPNTYVFEIPSITRMSYAIIYFGEHLNLSKSFYPYARTLAAAKKQLVEHVNQYYDS